MEFRFSAFPRTYNTVKLSHDTVLTLRLRDESPRWRVDTVRTVPTAGDWRAFWAATDRAGVSEWRPQYVTEGIMDGAGWELRLSVDGRTVESSGVNAYPDRRGGEHHRETPEFQSLVAGLEALAKGGSLLSPWPDGAVTR